MITEELTRPRTLRPRIRAALAAAADRWDQRICVCGCERATHRHFNRISNCGRCGAACRAWLPRHLSWWWALTGR